jgi:hypothetical protein
VIGAVALRLCRPDDPAQHATPGSPVPCTGQPRGGDIDGIGASSVAARWDPDLAVVAVAARVVEVAHGAGTAAPDRWR